MAEFKQIKTEDIKEVNGKVTLWQHEKSGARVMTVENDDNNKVFGISFRTPPENSTGVPHILEHTVLCGSQRYPVKDPFLQLLKGSMNTYLNAFTYPDRTAYPIGSTNQQDFLNQSGVYLDAVLNPLLKEEAFMQEGWRYEVNEDGSLKYNGIVFNEMKGAYSEPMNILFENIQQSLFPESVYSVDSGGSPECIPELTYEYFKGFHEKYYHPSNSYVFVYGNFNRDAVFDLLDERLGEFSESGEAPEISLQKRFLEPVEKECFYAVSEETDKSFVSVNWLLGEEADTVKELGLFLLDHVLLMTPASPLKKALIESELGEGLSTWGIDDSYREAIFSVGLKGVPEKDCPKVVELVLNTLKSLVAEGISKEDIEASLNTIEFSLRENNTGSTPQGLAAMTGVLKKWIYGKEPFSALKFEDDLTVLRKNLVDIPAYLEKMIQEYFLDNNHRTIVTLKPDLEKNRQEAEAELGRLEKVRSELAEGDLERIKSTQKRVENYQQAEDSSEALSTIPGLRLNQVNPEIQKIPLKAEEEHNITLLESDLFTNGVSYLSLGFNLLNVPVEILPYCGIYGRLLKEMGTTEEDYVSFNRRINSKTGGIGAGVAFQSVYDSEDISARFFLYGKVMEKNCGDLKDVMRDALLKINLDNKERFRQVVLESKSAVERQIIQSGHSYVQTRLSAHFDQCGLISENTGGISQLFFLRKLADRIDSDWSGVLTELERFKQCLITKAVLVAGVTGDGGAGAEGRKYLQELVEQIPVVSETATSWDQSLFSGGEALLAPSEVNYVGKGIRLRVADKRFSGATAVVMKYVTRSYLWEKIRVQGGAYGAIGSFNPYTGILLFSSYRDRNLEETLKVYDALGDHLCNLELSESELEKLKIGTISDIDGHMLPDTKGRVAMSRFLCGITDQLRQDYRNEIFNASIADFKAFGEQVKTLAEGGETVVLGDQDRVGGLNLNQVKVL